jgi:hypothetical protein
VPNYAARILIALLVSAALGDSTSSTMAEESKGMRFWNLTLHTITQLRLSPTGENRWGADQCQNDRDGTVEHDERLRITGVTPGRYDVKLTDETGRTCVVRNIEVRAGVVFTVEEKQLTDCGY